MNIHEIKPIPLTNTTAYLAGAIIGDGHLTKGLHSKNAPYYKVYFEVGDYDYAKLFLDMVKEIVPTKVNVLSKNNKSTYYVSVSNKSLWHFLVYYLRIPVGAKSRIVVIPEKIKYSSDEIKRWFLAGLFDTDGGKRGGTIGYTSASRQLVFDIQDMFLEFDIISGFEVWRNKKYNRFYYGLRIRKHCIDTFLRTIPVQVTKKFSSFAAVSEWPNETGLGML